MQITKDDAYIHLTGYNLDFFSGLLFSLGDNNNKEIINNIYKTLERVRGKYTSHTPTLSSCGPDPLLLSSQAVLNLSPTLRVRLLQPCPWSRRFLDLETPKLPLLSNCKCLYIWPLTSFLKIAIMVSNDLLSIPEWPHPQIHLYLLIGHMAIRFHCTRCDHIM